MDYFFDLLRFCKDFLLQWINLVGGIVGVAWLFFERVRRKEVSLKTFFVIVSVCLFFGMYNAWHEQYTKAKGGFAGAVALQAWAAQPRLNRMAYIILLKVYNSGQPGMVEGFRATIKTKDRVWKDLLWTYWPSIPDTQFRDPVDGRTFFIKEGDMLYNKLLTRVETGEWKIGYIVYVLNGISDVPDKWEITIKFTDALHREYPVSYSSAEPGTNEPRYFPGVDTQLNDSMPPSPTPNTEASPN